MKKKYMTPEMEIIDIKTDQYLLAGSLQANGLEGFIIYEGVADENDDAD